MMSARPWVFPGHGSITNTLHFVIGFTGGWERTSRRGQPLTAPAARPLIR